jgi:hypothetical protein
VGVGMEVAPYPLRILLLRLVFLCFCCDGVFFSFVFMLNLLRCHTHLICYGSSKACLLSHGEVYVMNVC